MKFQPFVPKQELFGGFYAFLEKQGVAFPDNELQNILKLFDLIA